MITTAQGDPINFVAYWDGSVWRPLAGGITPGPGFALVEDLLIVEGEGGPELWVGGTFAGALLGADEVPTDHYAIWRPGEGDGGCEDADLAEPFGVLDLSDINLFVNAFTGQNPIADFDDNGIWDLSDVIAYIDAFVAGCP